MAFIHRRHGVAPTLIDSVEALQLSQLIRFMSSRSIYLTTLLLGRLSPLRCYTVLVHILLQETASTMTGRCLNVMCPMVGRSPKAYYCQI